jgi:RNA polymerase sigma-70 factor (ECF subfamily)
MSVSEGRQEAAGPALFSRQRQQEIPSSGLAPDLSAGLLPDRASNSRKSPSGQADAMGHGGEVPYAVYHAAEPELTLFPGNASRNRKTNHRFVEENVSDEMLLKHVAEGDKAAMHIMFARHRASVSRFVQRMVRNPAIVDDLVSQVFLDVWRSANMFENRARVSTWLLSIARFKAIGSLRERARENIDRDDMLEIADDADTPEAALDRKETNGILRACIAKLSPAHREIIDLFYYRENSVSEMSEIVGIPPATVKSRIFYARKQLARILVNAGFEVATARPNVGLSFTRASGSQGCRAVTSSLGRQPGVRFAR